MELADLKRASPRRLEEVYAEEREVSIPIGCFRGVHLGWVESPSAADRIYRPLLYVGFDLTPFGVDFVHRRWFFIRRHLCMGRFEARIESSRWRETQTVCLHYEVSRLPGVVRSKLYDEVKPLTDSLCLGIGGIQAPSGPAEAFYFALERMPAVG